MPLVLCGVRFSLFPFLSFSLSLLCVSVPFLVLSASIRAAVGRRIQIVTVHERKHDNTITKGKRRTKTARREMKK